MLRPVLAAVAVLVLASLPSRVLAQAPAPGYAGTICHCAGYPGPHVHVAPMAPRQGHGLFGWRGGGGSRGGRPAWLYGTSTDGRYPGYDPIIGGNPNQIPGLPRGRRYYGGRYFGSFNNRFYGPQYGNF